MLARAKGWLNLKPHQEVHSSRTPRVVFPDVGIGRDQQIDAHELFKLSFHVSHRDVQCSSREDIGGGELFPGA